MAIFSTVIVLAKSITQKDKLLIIIENISYKNNYKHKSCINLNSRMFCPEFKIIKLFQTFAKVTAIEIV